MTPAPVVIMFLAAKPLRGAIRPYVPGGVAMEIWVSMVTFPWAGTMVSSALYRSYPAASEDPRVGIRALSECSLISRLSVFTVLIEYVGLS